ncbi:MAG: SPASM domain-containing protein [Candidatus Lokiarchaeota archaeon]
MTPCPLNPVYLGNVKTQHIQDIWNYSEILNIYRDLRFNDNCGKCTYKIICGGCRGKVFMKTNIYDGSDPSCFLNYCNNKKL